MLFIPFKLGVFTILLTYIVRSSLLFIPFKLGVFTIRPLYMVVRLMLFIPFKLGVFTTDEIYMITELELFIPFKLGVFKTLVCLHIPFVLVVYTFQIRGVYNSLPNKLKTSFCCLYLSN